MQTFARTQKSSRKLRVSVYMDYIVIPLLKGFCDADGHLATDHTWPRLLHCLEPCPRSSPETDTIAAISTPPGRGGIGIVRLSGPHATTIAEQLVRLRQPLEHARARLADVLDDAGTGEGRRTIDEAVVTFFAAPNSYTARTWWRLPPTVARGAGAAGAAGDSIWARDWPSRESLRERAFLSGRLDLTQAEAVRDLIEAQTLTQARQAARQMGGALSRRVAPVKQSLVELIALLEAGIDFAEDDVEVTPAAEIARRIGEVTCRSRRWKRRSRAAASCTTV